MAFDYPLIPPVSRIRNGIAPGYCGGWGIPLLIGSRRSWILLFGSSPFAAPNSRSPPKIYHSMLFTLPLTYPGATLHHGRPCPGPNLEAPSPSTRRSAPPLPATIHYPLPTLPATHSLVAPVSAISVVRFFPSSSAQPLCFLS